MLRLGWVVLLVLGVSALARAECCRLVKVESAPASVGARVCAFEAGPECAAAVFDGDVVHGAPVQICSGGAQVIYRERDPATDELGAPTTAACTALADVEL